MLKERKAHVIKYLHTIMKFTPHQQTASLVSELAEEAGSAVPSRDLMDKELMSWNQLKEANEAGITIGF